MATLHVCLDEAGCFRFDPHGTQYYIFTAVYTYEPAALASALTTLRFSLLKGGHDLPSFHCTTDIQANRNEVIARMLADGGWRFVSLVVEKRKVNPVLHTSEKFYPKFAIPLLRFLFRGCVSPGTDKIVVCTDTLPTGKKAGVTKALKLAVAKELPDTPVWLYHHPRHSNKWIQVADYCCWAVQRKWEMGDLRTYNQIKHRLKKTELDLCAWGDQTDYYAAKAKKA